MRLDLRAAGDLLPGEGALFHEADAGLPNLQRDRGRRGGGVDFVDAEKLSVVVVGEHFGHRFAFRAGAAERAAGDFDEAPADVIGGGEMAVAAEEEDVLDLVLGEVVENLLLLAGVAFPRVEHAVALPLAAGANDL